MPLTLSFREASASSQARSVVLDAVELSRTALRINRLVYPGSQQCDARGRTYVSVRPGDHGRALQGEGRRAGVSIVGGELDDHIGAAVDDARDHRLIQQPDDLEARAFALYEAFRPEIPRGVRGWGAKGTLDLDKIVGLAR